MAHRKITVNEKKYYYKVGRKNVEIRDEDMSRLSTPTIWDLKEISENDFIEAKRKVLCYYEDKYTINFLDDKYLKNAVVTPSDIETFIKQNNF